MQHVPLTRGGGVGFKPQHFAELINDTSRIDLLEIHAENYFGDGGILHHQLERLHALLPLSIHGVGLSVGGAARLTPPTWLSCAACVSVTRPHWCLSTSRGLATASSSLQTSCPSPTPRRCSTAR